MEGADGVGGTSRVKNAQSVSFGSGRPQSFGSSSESVLVESCSSGFAERDSFELRLAEH